MSVKRESCCAGLPSPGRAGSFGERRRFLAGQHGFLSIQDEVFFDERLRVRGPGPGPDSLSKQPSLTQHHWLLILPLRPPWGFYSPLFLSDLTYGHTCLQWWTCFPFFSAPTPPDTGRAGALCLIFVFHFFALLSLRWHGNTEAPLQRAPIHIITYTHTPTLCHQCFECSKSTSLLPRKGKCESIRHDCFWGKNVSSLWGLKGQGHLIDQTPPPP